MPEIVTCPICDTKFKRYAFQRGRKTCGAKCQKLLGKQAGKKWREPKSEPTAEQIAEATRCAIKLRPISSVPVAEPRRKCPKCDRRVRTFISVAGAVWLRAHRELDGHKLCEGSRTIVSYPQEKVCVNDD